ncbi:MAG TPA: hypothetical protein DD706_16605, partial [Nitrospiraceae bacterium]|nr:hypothetical protein [Nitrospiraceae bacterium]
MENKAVPNRERNGPLTESRQRPKGVLARGVEAMRAWLMEGYEGVESLRLDEVPDPQPGLEQVLLRVKFAALNPADAFLARRMYPANPSLPHILGRDGVGEIEAVGPGVENVCVGETVGILRCEVGVEQWGTLAEKVVVPAKSVARIPT